MKLNYKDAGQLCLIYCRIPGGRSHIGQRCQFRSQIRHMGLIWVLSNLTYPTYLTFLTCITHSPICYVVNSKFGCSCQCLCSYKYNMAFKRYPNKWRQMSGNVGYCRRVFKTHLFCAQHHRTESLCSFSGKLAKFSVHNIFAQKVFIFSQKKWPNFLRAASSHRKFIQFLRKIDQIFCAAYRFS